MDSIINRFPKIELSYEIKSHKKIPTSNLFYIAIPYGKKYFTWFTYYEDKPVCILVELNRYKNDYSIKQIYSVSSSFHSSLSLGTILYGTIVTKSGYKLFVLENIYYYKGKDVSHYPMNKKIKIFSLFFKEDIQCKIYHRGQIIFTMPVYDINFDRYVSKMSLALYRIYSTQTRKIDKYDTFYNYEPIHKINRDEKNFMVKPLLQNDIYELYDVNYNNNISIGIACVNSYKTSVLLNKLFRNIKENSDLDALELSDSDDEFENISKDKYVNLEKKILMKCVYRNKFKMWEPVSIVLPC